MKIVFYICVLFSTTMSYTYPFSGALEPVDTLRLPYRIAKVRTIYSYTDNTQINTYFSLAEGSTQYYFNYCVNAISPTTSFKVRNNFSNYISENKNRLLLNYDMSGDFYRLDTTSKIIDTVKSFLGSNNNEAFILNNASLNYIIPQKNTYYLYSSTFLESESSF